MSILEVNHIKKVYKTRMGGDEVTALRDVHFSVEPGELEKNIYHKIRRHAGAGTFGCEFFRRRRRICGDHGRIRKWQDNASEHPCKP